jgi:hypothetical protein
MITPQEGTVKEIRPQAGSVKQIQPQAGTTTRTSRTMRIGPLSVTEGEGKSSADLYSQQLDIKKKEADLKKKEIVDPNDPRRTMDKAKLQLLQSGLLYHQMMGWNSRAIPGIEKLPTRIPQGMANKLFGEVLGQNPYVEPFKGDQIETAASLMKIAAPSARGGERLIEMFQQTLPKIWSTPEESKMQIVNSMANGVYNLISADPEGFEEWVDAQDEAAKAGADPHLFMMMKVRSNMEKIVDELFQARNAVPSHAIVGKNIIMRDKSGAVELVPLTNYADARTDGYEEVGKKEAEKWRSKANMGK